jgi:predicted Zn-dependent protease
MEQEADRIGVELSARAGYDPYAAVTLWEKMRRVSDGEPPQWLSTHPSHDTRIADLRAYADRVAPLYRPPAGR